MNRLFETVYILLERKKVTAKELADKFEVSTRTIYRDIEIKENGDFLVKVQFPENDWVYGYILSFGEYIKVISPEYARKAVKERL